MIRSAAQPTRTPPRQVPVRQVALSVLVALAAFTVVLQQPPVEAQSGGLGSVGITPATASFTEPPLLPGGTSQGIITFQQRYGQPVEVHVKTLAVDPTVGDAHQWIRLERSGSMSLVPGAHEFRFHIAVPEGTPNGMYKAGIAYDVTPPEPAPQEKSSATMETSVTATIVIKIDSKDQIERLVANPSVQIPATEEGAPLRVLQNLTNEGNVDVTPRVRVQIHDKLQQHLLKEGTLPGAVLRPGQAEQQVFTWQDPGLDRGQYWVTVETLLYDDVVQVSTSQVLDVLAPGELARVAKLHRIMIDGDHTHVPTGTLVKLTAIVENIGAGTLVAEFDGEVRRDGELVAPLTSKPIEVGAGERANLTMLYRVDQPGDYEFVGRVFYGTKVTEEKSLLVNAQSSAETLPTGNAVLALAILMGLLAVARTCRGTGHAKRRVRTGLR